MQTTAQKIINLIAQGENLKARKLADKEILISKIWDYCKHSHNKTDLSDLQSFTILELKEILISLEKN